MADESESAWETLARWIPGYGAYREQEGRREDDRRTREFLARRLQECKLRLERLGSRAVAAGDLQAPLVIDSGVVQLDRAQSRLRAAVEGYASWFDRRSVDEPILERVCQHDRQLVSLVDQIDSLIQAWDGRGELPAELAEAIELLHARIDRRTELFNRG